MLKLFRRRGIFREVIPSLKKKGLIVVNKLNPMEQQIRVLAQAFSKLDISKIYIKPAIRRIIDSEINYS